MYISAFPDGGRWLRGNLHAHTTLSDGTVPPGEQAADYRAMGYDFLSVTDHNTMNRLRELNREDFLILPGWERDIPYGKFKCLHVVGSSLRIIRWILFHVRRAIRMPCPCRIYWTR